MTELVKKLIKTHSVSGRETGIAEVIKEEIKDFCDEVYTDSLGNLYAHKKGSGKKIMFAAHMDEIGFFATYIEENGFIRVSPVGGVNLSSAAYTQVVFESGVSGVLVLEENSKAEDMSKAEKYYIDIGTKSRRQSEKKVSLGDFAVVKGDFTHLYGKRYAGRPFDNRIGCAVLISAAKEIKESENDLYFVFTAQEEVGCRGALPAAFTLEPDYAVAVDVTKTGDTPGAKCMEVKLGDGAAIKVRDSSAICDRHLVRLMCEAAEKNKIPYQLEILEKGGTDTGAMQRSGKGAAAGAISVPARYIHTSVETVDLSDAEACKRLVCALCSLKL